MDKKVTFDYSKALDFLCDFEVEQMGEKATEAREILLKGTGAGNDFLGWVDLPINYDKAEFEKIKTASDRIRKDSPVFIVIGIGGSYLGARSAIEFLQHTFYNVAPKELRDAPEIYFVGNSMSGTYIQHLIDIIGERDFSINVISKSGTTTEPAIAFRIFKELIEEKYGEKEAAKRIYVTTDKEKGALKKLADEEGYTTFVIPDDIGGRFSVLTSVGLLPIAVSGANIDQLMAGAAMAREIAIGTDFHDNDALQYAAIRNILRMQGKQIEILANYEPSLHFISEWWKQLYGESEGKDQQGVFPAAVDLSTDLHSIGQFIQDGPRIMFETILNLERPKCDFTIKYEELDMDGLNYLAGKTLGNINMNAMHGSILAHTDGKVPNLMIHIPEQNEYYLGQLFYFFEFSCAVSGYILGVNPFNQPGVESYKNNMFALLGRPGYEVEQARLKERLERKKKSPTVHAIRFMESIESKKVQNA